MICDDVSLLAFGTLYQDCAMMVALLGHAVGGPFLAGLAGKRELVGGREIRFGHVITCCR